MNRRAFLRSSAMVAAAVAVPAAGVAQLVGPPLKQWQTVDDPRIQSICHPASSLHCHDCDVCGWCKGYPCKETGTRMPNDKIAPYTKYSNSRTPVSQCKVKPKDMVCSQPPQSGQELFLVGVGSMKCKAGRVIVRVSDGKVRGVAAEDSFEVRAGENRVWMEKIEDVRKRVIANYQAKQKA